MWRLAKGSNMKSSKREKISININSKVQASYQF